MHRTQWLYTTALCNAALMGGAFEVQANPQGGVVAAGSADIKTINNQKLEIHQHTDKAVIDWRSFDIDQGQHTEFKQPSKTSHTLNRVKGGNNPSQILGKLSANGKVTLVNPNGVFFGKSAQVDVNGLIATTADIKNEDFMAGKHNFTKASNNPDAKIINEGSITAKEAGLVGLVAPHVENHGIIQAKTVQLASGDIALDLHGDGLLHIATSDAIKQQVVKNTGKVMANGGTISITAAAARNAVNSLINIEGELTAPVIDQQGGRITIRNNSNGGTVNIAGKLDASNKKGKGGTVVATAETVKVSGSINADGTTGGGTVLVGGDYLGGKGHKHFAPKNIPIPTAKNTTITNTAKITANATTTGNGGNVIVWADDHTRFDGVIEAKGKSNAHSPLPSSKGGFVETSGKNTLKVGSTAKVTATGDVAGTWLLDPRNVTITSSQANGSFAGGSPNTFTPTGDSSTVDVANIKTALEGGTSVTITTGSTGSQDGDITWTAGTDLSLVLPSAVTLTLSAANSILLAGTSGNEVDITATGNALDLHLLSDNDGAGGGAIDLGYTNITTNGGNIIAGGGTDPFNTITPGDLTDSRAIGTASNNDGITIANGILNAGAGNITVRGAGRNVGGVANGINRQYGVLLNNGGQLQTSNGTITVHGTGGNGTERNYGVWVGGTNALITSATGNVTVIGVGGNGSANNNYGTYLASGGQITSTGSATLTINGTGGNGSSSNHGVFVAGTNALITSATGNVTVTGVGGNGSSSNYGAYLENGGQITSTGRATLTINGTGGNGTTGNHGVRVQGTNALITSATGNVVVTGVGGNGSNNSNLGTYLQNGGQITSTGSATLTINGTGGNGMSNNHGVRVQGTNALITSLNGAVTVNGTGGDESGNSNIGTLLDSGGQITSTGSATLNITGTGGNGTSDNHGVRVQGTNALITSLNGAVTVNGTGGDESGNFNIGTLLDSGGQITSTGSATLNITGTGGNGTSNNHGLYVRDTNARITSATGNVVVTGVGGNGSSNFNVGTYLQNGGQITSTGSATLTVTGTGGNSTGGSSNEGIRVNGSGGTTTFIEGTGTGAVTLNGTGGTYAVAGSQSLRGIMVISGGIVRTSKSLLTLNAVGGSSTAGDTTSSGLHLHTNSQVYSTSGTLRINASTPNASSFGLWNESGSNTIGGAGVSGNIEIFTDTINPTNLNNLTIQTTGTVTLAPFSSNSIGLNGGAGVVQYTSGVMDRIQSASKVIFGSTASGTATIGNNWDLSPYTFAVDVLGSSVSAGNITTGNNRMLLQSSVGDITLGGTITSTATGDAITLAASNGRLVNTAGSGALSATNGRKLVYTANPANDVLDGLVRANKRYNISYGDDISSYSGDYFFYSIAPTLTLTADSQSYTYDSTASRFDDTAYSLSGFIDGDTVTDLTGFTTVSTTDRINAGNRDITTSIGTLASSLGYGFVANNTPAGELTINQAPLTISANLNQRKVYGQADPGSYAYTLTSGSLLGSDGFSGALARVSGENAGLYAINQGSLAAGSNYTLSYNSADFEISKALLTLTPNAQNYTYNASNNQFNNTAYTLSGFKFSDTASVVSGSGLVSASDKINAGTRDITASTGTLNASNYSFIANTLNNGLGIAKANLTIDVNDASRQVGQPNPNFTYLVTGLKGNDGESVINNLNVTTPASLNSPAGTYAITAQNAQAQNYSFTYQNGILTLLPVTTPNQPITTAINLPATVEQVSQNIRGSRGSNDLTNNNFNSLNRSNPYNTAANFINKTVFQKGIIPVATDITDIIIDKDTLNNNRLIMHPELAKKLGYTEKFIEY